MQLCRIIYCSLTALHVSSDIIAHHQEHLNYNCSFCFIHMCRRLQPTTTHVNKTEAVIIF